MRIKLITLILIIVLISIAGICYYLFRFSGLFYRNVSGAMMHDSTTESVYYQWLENNLNYSRNYIDSWPIKNGISMGSLIQVEKTSCNQINVGDVIVYTVSGQNVPIVHRVIKINSDGTFMTKGDHNEGLLQFENSIACNNILSRVIKVF
jgi:signal peptidase I